MSASLLLTGIGLRAPHYKAFLEKRPGVAWLEIQSEPYFRDWGKSFHVLEQLRTDYPISLHGSGLSIGSTDELNWHYLKQLYDLMTRIQPCLVSDQLAWSTLDGHHFHDVLPLPYTEETLDHVSKRIQQVQDYLKRQILIKNIASYVQYTSSTISEPEFLREVAQRSGCGIVLDISHIYINATNVGLRPETYFAALPAAHIQEIHLAGFTTEQVNHKEILIDSDNRPIVPAVWDLFKQALQHLGRKPTIIEWNRDLPPLETLCLEAYRAEKIMREYHVTA